MKNLNIENKTVSFSIPDILVKNIIDDLSSFIDTNNYSDKIIDSFSPHLEKESLIIMKKYLPFGVFKALSNFSSNPELLVIEIKKIKFSHPKISIPNTPLGSFDYENEKKLNLLDALFLSFVFITNTKPVSNPSENNGFLIRNVVPKIGKEGETSSHGSKTLLNYHNDQPNYNPSRNLDISSFPDTLSFLTIRNNEKVNLDMLFVEYILDNLTLKTIKVLQEKKFKLHGPASTGISYYSPISYNSPLLDKEEYTNKYFLRFDPNIINIDDYKDPFIIDALKELFLCIKNFEKASKSYKMEKGDLLIFKNRYLLHKRKSFNRNKIKTQSRWLRRVYGIFN